MEPPSGAFGNYGIFIAHGAIALFGAFVHAAQAHRNGTSKGPADFILLTIMSSFSGVIFALAAFQVFDNPYITLAIAGSGGFLGVEGLSYLATTLKDSVISALTKKQ